MIEVLTWKWTETIQPPTRGVGGGATGYDHLLDLVSEDAFGKWDPGFDSGTKTNRTTCKTHE